MIDFFTILQIRPDIDWVGDPDRVDVLMSPFRDRSLNPHSWEAKMEFWSVTLDKWFASHTPCSGSTGVNPTGSSDKDFLPDPRFALSRLERELCSGLSRRPHCIAQVVEKLLSGIANNAIFTSCAQRDLRIRRETASLDSVNTEFRRVLPQPPRNM